MSGLLDISAERCGFEDQWVSVMVWTMIGCTLVYFLSGFVAMYSFRKQPYAFMAPLVFALFGGLYGIVSGVIAGAILAGVYDAGSFRMPPYVAFVWGIGLAALFGLLSTGRVRTF